MGDYNSPNDILMTDAQITTEVSSQQHDESLNDTQVSQFTKTQLQEMIRNRDERLVSRQPRKNKTSRHWAGFNEMYFNNTYIRWAMCIKCRSLCPTSNGPNCLKSDRNNCLIAGIGESSSSQSSISTFVRRKLNERDKDKITQSLLGFLIDDTRPLSLPEGKGFIKFCNTLIQVAANGPFEINDCKISR